MRMLRFEMLEHTADIRIRAFGRTLPELFVNSAIGMTSYLFGAEIIKNSPEKSEEISLVAADCDSLLVDWLSEILYRSSTQSKAFVHYEIKSFSDKNIVCDAFYLPAKQMEDIKAVTYHGLQIVKPADFWEATITFDI